MVKRITTWNITFLNPQSLRVYAERCGTGKELSVNYHLCFIEMFKDLKFDVNCRKYFLSQENNSFLSRILLPSRTVHN